MKKSLLLSNVDKTIYELHYNKSITSISYSKLDKEWTNPGKVAVTVVSDGNGYTVSHSDRTYRIDYCDAHHLYLALKNEFETKQKERYDKLNVRV